MKLATMFDTNVLFWAGGWAGKPSGCVPWMGLVCATQKKATSVEVAG